MVRQVYPSDITREQFTVIAALLEGAKRKTRPRMVDLYDVFCAILFVLKGAVPWRMLPHDFPRWDRVYKYFLAWSRPSSADTSSLLERALKKSGDRGAYQRWTQRKDELLHHRRAECEKHGHGTRKGL